MQECYVLQNVKLVDGNSVDIIVENKKIQNIVPAGTGKSGNVIDFKQKVMISSGWIDMHVHAFSEFEPYGDDVDEIGYKTGVTTIVDAGSTGADQLPDLVKSCKKSKTNVFAFLNISRIGLKRIDELSNLTWLDEDALKKTIAEHKDFIVGLKARISKSVVGPNGVEPLKVARKFSKDTGLPLMVHIGSGPPDINEVLDLLEKKDIVTHFLNGKANNLFDKTGKPLPKLLDAIKRGVHLDVGHGNASFSFQTAEQAKAHDIHFDTISTDIYRKNRLHGPVYNMASVLTKFLYLGYSLKEVIDAVTVKAAEWLNKPELGRISLGDPANLTLFSIEDSETKLMDSEGEERTAEQKIVVKGVVINGEYIEC
ncbi:amidohydrolase/deacetylase family metallohydrolase [Paenibacillus sp. BSR1-1]|uniref:amidohydrolase/deacetylase family metallohydrolase n=1 Tax=Paenibacillus sp. BSR1-1 TaxID=3020845 RepID=UPI0025B24B13|nr:amidohydrolase/deacetylase family metallohydrolase [Paenibacillus sp. BSR1-1]MDN3017241.1 amidohydrolase/deacetylase family metallohydrolase [Paenibacillus sp. BSR1-1]